MSRKSPIATNLFWLPACLGVSCITAKLFVFKPHPQKIGRGALHRIVPFAKNRIVTWHQILNDLQFLPISVWMLLVW